MDDEIRNISYAEDGLAVDNMELHGNNVSMSLKTPKKGFGRLNVAVEGDRRGRHHTVYTYTVDDETYVSSESEDDAWYKSGIYRYEEGLYTEEELIEEFNELSSRSIVEEVIIEEESDAQYNSNDVETYKAATYAATPNTFVRGRLTWMTSKGEKMPLKNTRIDLMDKQLIGSQWLKTTYTNDNGEYYFSITNADSFWNFENGGYDVFLRIYAESETFFVARDWLFAALSYYYFDTEVKYNIVTGSTVPIEHTIQYEPANMVNCAFYVQQGMVLAQQFAKSMGMRTDIVKQCVLYPFTDGYAAFSWKVFGGISKKYFNNFDVTMHEYGHLVENVIGFYGSNLLEIIINNPNHSDMTDHFTDKFSKDFAMELTWSESWATIFAQIAQEQNLEYKDKVSSFADKQHHSTDVECFVLDDNSGEAQEYAVESFLWDLYDSYSDSEPLDNISWGYRQWWNATARKGITTLTKFVNVLESEYAYQRGEIGELLGTHRIAPSDLVILNADALSDSVAPELSWKIGGSTDHPNQQFIVAFYDVYGSQIYTTDTINLLFETVANTDNYTYTVPLDLWQSVLRCVQDINDVRIAVKGYRLGYPSSGPYISNYAFKNIKIDENNRYFETVTKVYGDYTDYLITFAHAGYNVFQTFGHQNTKLALYDGGILQAEDDNSGNNLNGFLSYYVQSNKQYRLRVFGWGLGEIKLAIMPSAWYSGYEQIPLFNGDSINTALNLYKVNLFRFRVDSARQITLQTNATFDTYLYLINPNSTAKISSDMSSESVYNDDGGSGLQAKISKTIKPYVEYLIIVSAYNNSITQGNCELTCQVDKISVAQTIVASNFGYQEEYVKSEAAKAVTLENGFQFNTNRLRTGFITNKYLVLSAKRQGFDTAFLELEFVQEIYQCDFSMGIWSNDEGLSTNESYIVVQYLNENGEWVILKEFDVSTMSKDKDNLDEYIISLPSGVHNIRFYVHTNQTNYQKNKGRVVLDNIAVHYYEYF